MLNEKASKVRVTVSMTESAQDLIKAKAAAMGVTMSHYILLQCVPELFGLTKEKGGGNDVH